MILTDDQWLVKIAIRILNKNVDNNDLTKGL